MSPISRQACPSQILYLVGVCIVIVTSVADIHFVGDSQANWSLIYYSMTVATNSLCTTLILIRIMQVSGISAGLKTYRGIIEILIESAALYAVVYLALVMNRHIFTFSHLIISYREPCLINQRTVSSSVSSPIIPLFITEAVLMSDTRPTHG